MSEDIQKKSSTLAVVLSFIWCGLGQIYNGQTIKGIVLMILFPICGALFCIGIFGAWLVLGTITTGSPALIILILGLAFGITTLVLWIHGMIDAYKTAEKINKEQNQGTQY